MLQLYKNIKSKRTELGMTQSELAEKMGYADKSMIAKIEKGSVDLTQSKIIAFASILGVTPGELMGLDGIKEAQPAIPDFPNIHPIAKKRFPVLGSVSCGVPKFADEDRESYVMAGTDIKADFCLIASGDSMVNARIHDGDIIFIRQQDIVDNGDIAAVVIGDEALLKRVYYYRERSLMILHAENPKYEDLIYQNEELEQVHILGKAVAFQSDIE